jgi:hypothetical protein
MWIRLGHCVMRSDHGFAVFSRSVRRWLTITSGRSSGKFGRVDGVRQLLLDHDVLCGN